MSGPEPQVSSDLLSFLIMVAVAALLWYVISGQKDPNRSNSRDGYDDELDVDDQGYRGVATTAALTRFETPGRRWLRRRGWRMDTDGSFIGRFRTGFTALSGRIELRAGRFKVYIHNPPRWLTTGQHSECLWARGEGWFLLHLRSDPESLKEVICAVEGFLVAKYAEAQGVTR